MHNSQWSEFTICASTWQQEEYLWRTDSLLQIFVRFKVQVFISKVSIYIIWFSQHHQKGICPDKIQEKYIACHVVSSVTLTSDSLVELTASELEENVWRGIGECKGGSTSKTIYILLTPLNVLLDFLRTAQCTLTRFTFCHTRSWN